MYPLFEAPQIIYLILTLCGLFMVFSNNGVEKLGKNVNFMSSLFGMGIIQGLFWWGGFYDGGTGFPELIVIVYFSASLLADAINNGEPINRDPFLFRVRLVLGSGLMMACLYFGEFFGKLA